MLDFDGSADVLVGVQANEEKAIAMQTDVTVTLQREAGGEALLLTTMSLTRGRAALLTPAVLPLIATQSSRIVVTSPDPAGVTLICAATATDLRRMLACATFSAAAGRWMFADGRLSVGDAMEREGIAALPAVLPVRPECGSIVFKGDELYTHTYDKGSGRFTLRTAD